MVPIHQCHSPSGSSSNLILHYLQLVKYGHFGKRINGTKMPTDFPLHKITVPMIIHYSTTDAIVDYKDVDTLILKLNCSREICAKKIRKPFNHLDFVWSFEAKQIHSQILTFFHKFCWIGLLCVCESNKIYFWIDKI